MRTFIFIFKVVIVSFWFLGLIDIGMRELFWSMPAGYAVGVIIAEFFLERKFGNISVNKVFDSRDDNVPQEVKDKMKELFEILKSKGKLPQIGEKCKDPHCEACWGLADNNDESKI